MTIKLNVLSFPPRLLSSKLAIGCSLNRPLSVSSSLKMPTSNFIGTPGPANDLIGGIPTLHYLDFLSRGRGQVIRLFFEDAGIAYHDIRYSYQEFPSLKQTKFIDGGLNPTGNLPVIELNGEVLTQSYPIMRHFSYLLGKYDGETEEEKFWVDRLCDIAIDCE